jgi:hypothetical protein
MIGIVAEALIIEAAVRLGATEGNWATLVDVRQATGLSRDDFDRAAHRLAIKGTATFAPEENQKTITVDDVEASIFIGEPKHLITIH